MKNYLLYVVPIPRAIGHYELDPRNDTSSLFLVYQFIRDRSSTRGKMTKMCAIQLQIVPGHVTLSCHVPELKWHCREKSRVERNHERNNTIRRLSMYHT